MNIFEKLENIIEPVIKNMGYELVRVKLSGDKRKTLQIMVERLDEKPMGIEDCSDISRQISAVLDVEDPISERYNLEVSSPGLDRPLTKLKDFIRFKGFIVKMQTLSLIENRKKFTGVIKDVIKDEEILLEVEGKEFLIPFNVIDNAKLVITDDMLKQLCSSNK